MIEAYCSPVSVTAGDSIDFKVSCSADFDLSIAKLNPVDAVPPGKSVWGPARVTGKWQDTPTDAASNGCRWESLYTFHVPSAWSSGVYSARCTSVDDGSSTDAVFIVKPSAGRRGDIALLVNINTWNAYNGWGGPSKYDYAVLGSFDRPFGYCTQLVQNGTDHTALAELWVQNWLERWYVIDTFADSDLDAGIPTLSQYRALLLSTHPEYWSIPMLDHLSEYLNAGGNLIYLGGNGVFEHCEYTADRTALTFWGGDSTQPRERNFLRNLYPPRPERNFLGVAYRFNNYLTHCKAAPFEIKKASHRFFRGTSRPGGGELKNGDLVGATGRNRPLGLDTTFGAASGWEFDTSLGGSAAPGVIVNCWEPGRPTYVMDNAGVVHATATPGTDRGDPPSNLELLARGTNDSAEGKNAADMTCYQHPIGGGFVFAAASITFGGSLVEDGNLQQIVMNALDDALGWVDPNGSVYSAIWKAEGGPAWQARHGLTAQQHQEAFDTLVGQGYRQTAISGYAVAGAARFASIWVQTDGPAWWARHGLSGSQHQQLFDELTLQGYRLTAISGYEEGGQDFYASIWRKEKGPAWQARHGLNSIQHQQAFDALCADGYRMTAISGYAVNGEARYASIWVKAGGPAWQARHGQDATQHQRTFNDLTARGYRLTAVSSYEVAGVLQFASIWEQTWGPAWQARHGITAARYQREFNLLGRQGYRLVAISGSAST